SERRQFVVAAAGVIELGGRPLTGFDDQPIFDRLLNRAVEGGRPETHLPVAALQYFLHDAVTVLFATGEGDENMEPITLEWQERFWGLPRHEYYISDNIYISQDNSERNGMSLFFYFGGPVQDKYQRLQVSRIGQRVYKKALSVF